MLPGMVRERQEALEAVEAYLKHRELVAKRLQPDALLPFQTPRFTPSHGWTFLWGCSDGKNRGLVVLVDDGFPYSAPKIGLAEPLPNLSWPHLEYGLLCILDSESTFDSSNPAGVVDQILKRAIDLIEDSITGRNREDFQNEFTSYWLLGANLIGSEFRSMVDLAAPSRLIKAWHGKSFILFTDDEEQGTRWLNHWGWSPKKTPRLKSMRRMPSPTRKPRFWETLFCWLPEPLLPEEYPNNNAELADLLRQKAPDAYQMLCDLLRAGVRSVDILFGTETAEGKCAFALSMQAPLDNSGHGGKKNDRIQKGFRPGRVPTSLIDSRAFSPLVDVIRRHVVRVDASWIHGRDHNSDLPVLKKCKVAIIGCGALGSVVARSLVQAGVGSFLLVDPDFLQWENISRHQLGASSLKKGIYKTAALKANLEQDFPHIQAVTEYPVALSLSSEELWEELKNVDVVISLTGNWAAENLLNRYQHLDKEFPPVVYAWMESHAVVGHAVAITSNRNGCFQCGFNHDGTQKVQVTQWPDGKRLLHVPACSDPFSPYGSTDLAWSHALAAQISLDVLLGRENSNTHRIWFGSRQILESKGGSWSRVWIENHWDPGNGLFVNDFPWPKDGACPVCSSGPVHVTA